MSTTVEDDWTALAKCRGMGDAMFPDALEQKRIRKLCVGCPVRARCLAEALDAGLEWGVWGGMTERQRRLLLRQQPDVTSWSAVLCGKPSDPASQIDPITRRSAG